MSRLRRRVELVGSALTGWIRGKRKQRRMRYIRRIRGEGWFPETISDERVEELIYGDVIRPILMDRSLDSVRGGIGSGVGKEA